jgi:hypothetical protein
MSASERREMIAKRDRLIWAMHRENRTQEAIGAELDVPQRTVANVIERLSQNRDAAKTAKPKQRAAPPKAVPDPVPEPETVPEAVAPAETAPPAYRINLGPYLPLLDRLRPVPESDDQESGAVGSLPDVDPQTEDDDPAAVRALAMIESTLFDARTKLNKLGGLRRQFGKAAALPALAEIGRVMEFLDELQTYIEDTNT